MKVALVYDRVNKWGGAERVLLALHEIFPDAPLYTSVYNPETAPWAGVFPKVIPSFLQKFLHARSSHELYAPLMPLAFESFSAKGGPAYGWNFDNYDLVISVTSEAAKGVITRPGTIHICYCLTPTRYLWSGYDTYFGEPITKFFTKPIVSYLRKWDKIAAHRPDKMVAISRTVAGRIKKYYGRESEVIYPPVELDVGPSRNVKRVLPLASPTAIPPGNNSGAPSVGLPGSRHPSSLDEYFLIVSRLVPYKRIDLAIEAFNQLGLPLVIVGTGREGGKLKRMAGKNIHFVGHLTDRELARYYEKAAALIFPQEEDFGIAAVESQMIGTPVIAYRKGGATETIISGKTGEFFESQTSEALIKIVENFNRSKYSTQVLQKHAKKFEKERFKKEFKNLVKVLYE